MCFENLQKKICIIFWIAVKICLFINSKKRSSQLQFGSRLEILLTDLIFSTRKNIQRCEKVAIPLGLLSLYAAAAIATEAP